MVLLSRRLESSLLAFGLAFADGAMVHVSLPETLDKPVIASALAHDDRAGFASSTFFSLAPPLLASR